MYGARAVPAPRAPRRASTRRGTRSARCGWRRTPERFEELRRQAGWAKTFGLPLELIGPDEAPARFPLMSPDGVLGAVCLPTDGWLDPSGLALALAAGARAARRADPDRTRGSSGSAWTRGRVTGRRRRAATASASTIARRRRRQRRRHVRAGDRPPGRRDRARSSRWPTSTSSPSRSRASPRPARRCATRTTSSTSARRSAACAWAATSATRRRGRSTASRPTSTASCSRPTGRASRRSWTARSGASRRSPTPASTGSSTARRASRRTTSSSSASRDVRGFFVAAGFSRARHRGRRRHRPPDGALDRRRRARARPLEDGHPPVRAAVPLAQAYTLARTIEIYATYYDIHYPNEERQAGRPLRTLADLRRARRRSARRSARSRAGSGRTGSTSNAARPATRRLRPRGWAGEHWSPAIGAEALATRERGRRCSTRRSFAKIEVVGPGALAFLQRLCANDVDRPVGRDRLHPAAQPRAAGSSATSPSPAWHADRFLIVTGTAFGNHDLGWIARAPARTTARWPSATSRRRRACFGLWGPRARDILGAAHARRPRRTTAFPYLTAREITVGYVPCLALRVTYVGELGWELYPPTEYGRALWRHALGGRPAARPGRRRLPRDRRAAAREGLPRLVERHHAGGDARTRPASGFAVALDKPGGFIGRDALAAAKAAGPTQAAALPRPRRSALDLPRQRAGAARRRDRAAGSRPAATASPSSAASPTPTCRRTLAGRAPASRSTSSASGSAARSCASRSTTPPASGSARDGRRFARRMPEARSRGWLALALELCDEADAIALAHFRRDLRDRDQARPHLRHARPTRPSRRPSAGGSRPPTPTTGWSARSTARTGDRRRVRWYIDPIDGTHNFMRGVPLFGTLLALEERRRDRARRDERAGARQPLVRVARWWRVGAGSACPPARARPGAAPAARLGRRATRGCPAPLLAARSGRHRSDGRRAFEAHAPARPGGRAASATSGATRWWRRARPRRWSRRGCTAGTWPRPW